MPERIQKILRQWGIASRREAEKMIAEGRVKVNGVTCKLGDKADPQTDKIAVDNQDLKKYRPKLVYLLINKPKDYICTCDDPKGRKTILDLLPINLKEGKGIHPVGRLDRNSTGALILTNDGNLTMHLTHPRYHAKKTYLVTVTGSMSDENLQQWAEGFLWEGKQTLPAEIILNERSAKQTKFKIILQEGRNRQIRKIAELFGHPVITLHRQAIGSIKVSSLAVGKYRHLNQQEISELKKSTPQAIKNREFPYPKKSKKKLR